MANIFGKLLGETGKFEFKLWEDIKQPEVKEISLPNIPCTTYEENNTEGGEDQSYNVTINITINNNYCEDDYITESHEDERYNELVESCRRFYKRIS